MSASVVPGTFVAKLCRRSVVERCLLLGLAGAIAAIGAASLAARQATLLELTAAAVLGALIPLIVGARIAKRAAAPWSAMEEQLRRLASDEAEPMLTPVITRGDVAQGWNRLLRILEAARIETSLEEKLKTSLGAVDHQRWLGVVNALSDGVAVTDATLAVVQSNNAFGALLNVTGSDELHGQNIVNLFVGTASSETADAVRSLARGTGASACDLLRGTDAAEGVLRITRTPLLGDAFGAGSFLWTVRDVTQQRLADAMRNQFVCTATHELRTPLSNITAYSELLVDQVEVDVVKQKEFCNHIYSEASRLSRFIDQMLNVSRMEAGAVTLDRHETDVARLIDEVVAAVQPQSHQKRQVFTHRVPPKLPKLRIDKDKIAATLVNLLGNAVKYTPEGGAVSLIVEQAGDALVFHVDDNGIGIAADELPRIGSKFFRSADDRVRDITGSGLGLAFGQEVARLHGGEITVASELNKGSRFSLALPCGAVGV